MTRGAFVPIVVDAAAFRASMQQAHDDTVALIDWFRMVELIGAKVCYDDHPRNCGCTV